jgi:O-glycosyl hydrolase
MRCDQQMKKSNFPKKLLAAASFVLCALSSLCHAQEFKPAALTNLFVVDVSVKHQVMDNFGANDAWSFQKIGAWSETNKNRIADLLFSTNTGIGLSCWRFYFGAGLNRETIRNPWRTSETFEVSAGNYDWSRQANERWFLRAAKARGVPQFAATVYSPPGRLTRNGLSNLGSDKISTTNLKPGAEACFAGYLTDILAHFRDNPDVTERVAFNYIFPVNEPQWEWVANQEGNRAANADLKKIFTALKRRLEATGLPTKILGPESGSIPDMYSFDSKASEKWHADYGDYLRTICDDPQLAKCFDGILTYHSYWSDALPDQLVPHRAKLGRALANDPGWKLWQTEYCVMERGRDLTMDTALRVARVIHCDLTRANASAWQWWEAVSNEDFKSGLIYTDYHRPGDAETIYESKILWALGNYSRFIRPGMQRVELRANMPEDMNGVLGSAYLNPNNGQRVFVFVNMSQQAQRVQVAFADVEKKIGAAKRFIPFTTSAKNNLAAGEPMEVSKDFELPARGVVTLVEMLSPN